MADQSQQNSFTDALNATVMASTEEFKGLEPDKWIDLAVRQCLAAALVDSQKYYQAVINLEGTLVMKLDEQYFNDLEALRKQMFGKVPEDEIDFRLAGSKFKLLIAVIDRKKPSEATLEL